MYVKGVILRKEMYMILGGNYTAENCEEIHILDSHSFFPMAWYEATLLVTEKRSPKDWDAFLRNSYSIDFYKSSSKSTTPIRDRKYYGKKIPAYAHLGPKYCPMSFKSDPTF